MFLQPKHEEQVTTIENSLPLSRLIILYYNKNAFFLLSITFTYLLN
jgi:hypothetical protein